MKKRILYYFLHFFALLAIIFLSFYLYFRDIHRTLEFLLERRNNVILIFFMLLLLLNIFNLVGYKKFHKSESFFIYEIFTILSKILIIILIVSFTEFFIFYKTKVGRVVYFNLFVLLSFYFSVETIVYEKIIQKKGHNILWLSDISFDKVKKDYLFNINHNVVFPSFQKGSNYDIAIYDYPPRNKADISRLLSTIIAIKTPIDLITYIEEYAECVPLRYVDELWLLRNIRVYENLYDKVRRIFNVVFSLILLLILFPPSFLVALVHRITSEGPIFFIQERVGYKGKPFRLIKFRTMVPNAEENGPQFASKDDPRITKIGKIMRLFRIDEVPQLINILKGDMNLIGPRPERKEFIDMLEKEIPFYRLRLEVRPGLTGWAQVNYPYAGEKIEDHLKKLEYDLYYIKNRGLPLDILILFKTIKTVIMRKGT